LRITVTAMMRSLPLRRDDEADATGNSESG
jgi:hypothetical protein